jgi:hypothetical protein
MELFQWTDEKVQCQMVATTVSRSRINVEAVEGRGEVEENQMRDAEKRLRCSSKGW